MSQTTKEQRVLIAGLIVAAIISIFVAAYTHIPAGGADNYAHFNISRWAFRYPHLFLDHWGKPVYTLLTAPFAQLGMWGVRIFNVICGLITAWFVYQLALHFNWRFAWFSVIVVIFTPIYFVMMFSSMTEVLFSLFLVVSIYLFFKEKYLLSAVIVSSIFLVRTEGFAFLLPFIIAFLFKKQYKYIPFLFTGFILFSLIGWIFFYHDFWWLINHLPYATGSKFVYDSGDWYYFFVRMPQYFGYVVPVFLLAGSVLMVMRWLKKGLRFKSDDFFLIVLVLGSFWGYFFIHSYLWWVGGYSAGLTRVMAGIAPLSGFITVFFIHNFFNKKTGIKVIGGSVIVLGLYMVVSASAFYHRSTSRDLSAEILERVTAWLKRPENIKHKLVVHNPYFAFSTGIDAWDNRMIQYGFSDNDFPEKGLPDSALFVWDAHFSPNEGGMPLEKIMENENFELAHYFEPVVPFKVLGDNDYKIFIFRKISGSEKDNASILREIQRVELEKGVYHVEVYDFENPFTDRAMEERRILTDTDSLNFIYNLDGTDFSPAFNVPVTHIDDEAIHKLRVTVDIRMDEQVQSGKLLMVFSIERDSEVFHYATSDILEHNPEPGIWNKNEFIFVVPRGIKKGALLKTYIWNIEKNNVLLDNFTIEYIGQPN